MIPRAPEQQISSWGQIFFLICGLFPIGMLVQYWARSGTGLNSTLVGFTFLLVGAALLAMVYFSSYRQNKPRSALVPPGPIQAVFVALLLFGLGTFNMLATPHGLGLQLSPGPKIESSQLLPTMAKVVVSAPGKIKLPPAKTLDLRRQTWMLQMPYMRGGLWGALGYALAFGLAGAIFGLFRKELYDPRDEHLGAGMLGALVRGGVGLYYGTAMGFMAGGALIAVLRTLFPTINAATPPQFLHWIYVFGAASNPNTAFTYAFTTACMLAAASTLFLGRRDFTAQVSDPKAPELTRPLQMVIPPVPPAPQMAFDMGKVQAESQQILSQFSGELTRMFRGPEWEYEQYNMPPIGRCESASEPATSNILSARQQDEGDYDTALGSLSNVYVEIVAELGKLEISAYDWAMLAEGALLELPKSPDGTINVSINGKPAGKARTLIHEGYKAVKVVRQSPRAKSVLEQLVRGM